MIGGVAGAGIAVGPILGGWATTELTWRIVFAGEVVLCLVILALTPKVADAALDSAKPRLDVVGAILSAAGLGAIVLGVLQASVWGWLQPKQSPITPLGFSLTPFVVGAGAVLIWLFVQWQRRRERQDTSPLVHLDLVRVPPLRAGLIGLFTQNLILMGVFFVVPLYLQLVLGMDALDTGIRMLPISITMLLASAAGSRLSQRMPVRTIVRLGLGTSTVAIVLLLATIRPELADAWFAISMAVLGIGMGLIVSQLGNVVQSSVDTTGRSEAGGLQYTGQQLGSSLGVALIGAIVLSGLTSVLVATVQSDESVSAAASAQVGVAVESGLDFLSVDQVAAAVDSAGIDAGSAAAIVDDYATAQLASLRLGLLVAAALALSALPFTRNLPHERVTAGP